MSTAALSDPHTEIVLIQQIGAITVAVVTTIGIILVALLNRTRQHAKAAAANSAVVKNEVKNDHSTNFRDESDERHAAILEAFDSLKAIVKTHGRQIEGLGRSIGGIRDELRGMRDDDRQVREELDTERERIRALEDTQPSRGTTRGRGSRPRQT